MSGFAVARIRQLDTHRLVSTKYGDGGEGALGRIADDEGHLGDILDLDRATDDGLLAETGLLPGIGVEELVFGVPHHRVVNAAFSYAHPSGGRFNGPDRGAWYAGFDIETSQAEVAWHKSLALAEIGCFEDSVTCDDYLADFSGEYCDLRGDAARRKYLDPNSYVESQSLAETLLEKGASGIVYPSVRRDDGVCLACFRPALVGNVRRHARYRFTWAGSREPEIECEEIY